MKNWIIRILGIDNLEDRLSKLEEEHRKLEEGVMHDDYPKCIPPDDCAFSLCKHGRLTMSGKIVKRIKKI